MDWEAKCRELQSRIEELEAENRLLRSKLGMVETTVISTSVQEEKPLQMITSTAVHMRSHADEKIKLFRNLFRGREDVFARRWYSVKKEKGGYSPVCANEWRDGVCIKPKGTCSKCEYRELVALNDQVIFDHLSGKDSLGRDVIGLYPILPDDTCYFLAIDFDDDAGHRFYVHAVLQGDGGKRMPLRYNYDKPEMPRISKGFWDCQACFSSFSKPKNRAAK